MYRSLLVMCLFALAPIPARAQSAPSGAAGAPGAAHRAAVARASWLEGTWSGTGTMQMGPNVRRTFDQTETVRRVAGGTVLMIEGLGVSTGEGEGAPPKGTPIHQAFATVTWDADRSAYVFRPFVADGRTFAVDGEINEGKLVWGYDDPRAGRTRYTITREGNTWREIGEATRDGGATWYKFFEMTLQRAK